jgi:hypothetical protein
MPPAEPGRRLLMLLRVLTMNVQNVGQPGHRRRLDYVFVGSRDAHPETSCRIESARLAFDQPTDGV